MGHLASWNLELLPLYHGYRNILHSSSHFIASDFFFCQFKFYTFGGLNPEILDQTVVI